ncbi:hypothetical protein NLU13_0507 [Sarocladium strictum]|uniref:Heterokaryon incompatibility domain-containing protein n=1 Tax=Sarocladium strictum TaxID=5046 RepID=A0AA39GP65_SARSR|nr:hypothetical protein NLU13_0507 [Sarocladium strictum]
MAPARRRYSYPTSLPGGSIRLLRLPSGPIAVPITEEGGTEPVPAPIFVQSRFSFGLEVYDYASKPSYRALSYTWGPACDPSAESNDQRTDPRRIILQGEVHEVTRNLLDALCQCSLSFPGSLLWVDALCINQDDLLERQVHVALMDQVYRNAQQVLLWVGLATAKTRQLLGLIHKIARIGSAEIELARHFDHPRDFAAISKDVADAEIQLWKEYLAFYERTWFQRGWRMRKHFFASLNKRIFSADVDALALGRNIWRVKLIQDACSDPDYAYLLVVGLCTGSYSLDSAEHILIHLMRMSRDFNWTDMRDRVYSLLGLVAHTAKRLGFPPISLRPDYSPDVTAAHVLTKVAEAVMLRSNYVGIIAQVSDLCFRSIKDLPSWVPGFYKQFNYAMGHISPLNACGHIRRPDLAFSVHNECLRVQGQLLGILKEQRDICSLNNIDWSSLRQLMQLAASATLPAGRDRIDVLWRTMLWDIGSHENEAELHPASAQLGDSFLKWALLMLLSTEAPCSIGLETTKAFDSSDELSEKLTDHDLRCATDIAGLPTSTKWDLALTSKGDIRKYIMTADAGAFLGLASGPTWMQQLFTTSNGYLGMGPKSGEVGDEAWLVNGCPFPMVLRRATDHFKVIGRCYVHGVMHGEALEKGAMWEELVLL